MVQLSWEVFCYWHIPRGFGGISWWGGNLTALLYTPFGYCSLSVGSTLLQYCRVSNSHVWVSNCLQGYASWWFSKTCHLQVGWQAVAVEHANTAPAVASSLWGHSTSSRAKRLVPPHTGEIAISTLLWEMLAEALNAKTDDSPRPAYRLCGGLLSSEGTHREINIWKQTQFHIKFFLLHPAPAVLGCWPTGAPCSRTNSLLLCLFAC